MSKDKSKDKDLEKEFNDMAKQVKDLKTRPSNSDLLVLYGLYKQCTVGDCDISQPWAVQLEARAKWDAWNEYKGTDTAKAMKKYVKKAKELIEKDK
jgi:diazepam-binding inhibitor (GABA receptor modulating acyl-CoA-binding protein)